MNEDLDKRLRLGGPAELAAEPDRLQRALRQVKARQRRRAGLGAGGVSLVVAGFIVVTLAGVGGGNAVLQQQQPAAGAGSSPSPRATARSAVPGSSLPNPSGTPGALSATPIGPPSHGASSAPKASASAQPATGAAHGRAPVTSGSVPVSNGSELCSGGQAGVGGGTAHDNWCESVAAVSNNDGSLQLVLDLCRPTQAGTADLHFRTAQEVDFTVRQGSHALWRWGAPQSFPATAHTVTVGTAGTCYEWQTRWNARLDSGRAAPSGNYTLVGHSSSRELGANDQTNTFQI